MSPFTWSRNWSLSCADFWIALMIAVFCCASESICAFTSLSVEAVVESGAIVCVGFWDGALEQPTGKRMQSAETRTQSAERKAKRPFPEFSALPRGSLPVLHSALRLRKGFGGQVCILRSAFRIFPLLQLSLN
jgi:hypothetical protein